MTWQSLMSNTLHYHVLHQSGFFFLTSKYNMSWSVLCTFPPIPHHTLRNCILFDMRLAKPSLSALLSAINHVTCIFYQWVKGSIIVCKLPIVTIDFCVITLMSLSVKSFKWRQWYDSCTCSPLVILLPPCTGVHAGDLSSFNRALCLTLPLLSHTKLLSCWC